MFAWPRIPGRDELAARGLTMSPQRPDLPVNDRCYQAAPRGRSALDVGELLPHEPVAEPQDVDAPNVTRRSVVVGPGESPSDAGSVTADKDILVGELRVGGLIEEPLPHRSHCCLALIALPIRCRAGRLEDAVIGHPRHDRIDLTGAESHRKTGQRHMVGTP